MNRLFVTNADLSVGDAIAHRLLTGEHRDHFDKVSCSVREVARSGDLWTLGACVHQLTQNDNTNERLMESQLRDCNTLVLVPDCASPEMEQQAQCWLRAAKTVGIKNCLLISIAGADERDLKVPMRFGKIEDHLKQAGIENICIIRRGVMQEALFWFAEDIKQERRLPLPIKDEKFAPLNLHDLTFVVSHLLSEGAAMMRGQARNQVYQLTGSELMTGRVLAERMSRVLNAQVQFEAVDPKKTEEWLRRRLHNEEILREIMDTFELIARGKLGFVSQDEKKTTGREPVTVDQWLKDNANRFKPMKQ